MSNKQIILLQTPHGYIETWNNISKMCEAHVTLSRHTLYKMLDGSGKGVIRYKDYKITQVFMNTPGEGMLIKHIDTEAVRKAIALLREVV